MSDAIIPAGGRKAVNQKVRINMLRLALLVSVPVILFARPALGVEGPAHEMIESLGILLLIAGVLGRFWSILYIGGQKNASVVTEGPFSMTRNPLYFSSTVAATGIGLMLGALAYAVLLGGLIGAILYVTARREAAFLRQQFGPAYEAYSARVPFFLPDPRLFHAAPEAVFRTAPLRRNLFDAFVFLSFIPLVEVLDTIKEMFGWSWLVLW